MFYSFKKNTFFLVLFIFCLLATPLSAQPHSDVGLAGIIKNKALIVFSDGKTRTMAVGETYQNIKLLSLREQNATIEITLPDKTTQKRGLRLGQTVANNVDEQKTMAEPTNNRCTPRQITLTRPADSEGMYIASGYINNKPVQFLVDTGATYVSMSEPQARKIGIKNYKEGKQGITRTANGTKTVYYVTLDSVRVSSIQLQNVPAVIGGEEGHPKILLGNSFLKEFDIRTIGNTMHIKQVCP